VGFFLWLFGGDFGSAPDVECRPPETLGYAQLESGNLTALRQAVFRTFAILQKVEPSPVVKTTSPGAVVIIALHE